MQTNFDCGKISGVTGKELETHRLALGLSREEMAKKLKTTYTTVYRWESGSRKIPNHIQLVIEGIVAQGKDVPNELKVLDFSKLTDEDIQKIVDFAQFIISQK